MDQPNPNPSILDCLKGEQLSAVIFVQDYLQLQFDGLCLTALVWPSIKWGELESTIEVAGYRDRLGHIISKKVAEVSEEAGEFVRIDFDDDSVLMFSLMKENRSGPEALIFRDTRKNKLYVW